MLLLIMLWFSAKPRPTWSIAGVFSLGYGCLRFVGEFFREPDQHIGFELLGWVTRGQLLCLPMIALGIYLITSAYAKEGRVNVARAKTKTKTKTKAKT